ATAGNLSAATAGERRRQLDDAGSTAGSRADIQLRKLSAHVTVLMAAELESHRVQDFQTFERAIASLDEVVSCWAVGGGFDYILQIVTRDIDSYQRLVDHLLEARVGLSRYFTYVVTKPVKLAPLPLEALLSQPQKE